MEKYYLLTSNEDWADEHNVPALNVMTEEELKQYKETKIYPTAYLGNSGDGFGEDISGSLGKKLIKSGFVQVEEIDKSFYNTFKKLDLSNLSLTNVLELNQEEDY